MHNLDPNDMDALFREGAEQQEFPYNPQAWDMMEERLDKKDRKRTIFWFLLGFLFIAGSVGIYYLSSKDSTLKLSQKENLIAETNQNIEVKTIDKSNNTQRQEVETTINKEEYIITDSKVRSRNIVAQNSGNTGSLVSNEVVSNSSLTSEISDFPIERNTSIQNVQGIDDEENRMNTGIDIPTMVQKRNLISVNTLFAGPSYIRSVADQISMDLEPTVMYFSQEELDPVVRYVATGYASTDFSSVGLFSEYKAGVKLGTKVGIQFAERFQVDLGIAYSLKKYGSEGAEYKIEGGWENMVGIDPKWMDAKCSIIEIPLETSYYFSGYRESGFFLNAGVSSYFLKSEWYGFKYDPSEVQALVDPNRIIDEVTMSDIPERNLHILGSGKISIGYQKVVSDNLSFEVSPYLQVPLTGIGQGKVDLYNIGIQFAAKFNSK